MAYEKKDCHNYSSSHCTCGRAKHDYKKHDNKKHDNKKKHCSTQNKLINVNIVGLDNLLLPGPLLQPAPEAPIANLNGNENGNNNGNNGTNGNGSRRGSSYGDQNKLININVIDISDFATSTAPVADATAKTVAAADKKERLTNLANTIRSNFTCRRNDGDQNKLININVVSLDDLVA